MHHVLNGECRDAVILGDESLSGWDQMLIIIETKRPGQVGGASTRIHHVSDAFVLAPVANESRRGRTKYGRPVGTVVRQRGLWYGREKHVMHDAVLVWPVQ